MKLHYALLASLALMSAGCADRMTFSRAGEPRAMQVDEFDDFDEAFEEEEASRPTRGKPARKPRAPRGPREYKMGVRTGGLLFAGADVRAPDGGRVLLGGFYRKQMGPGLVEVGLDLGANTADVAEEELVIFRGGYLYPIVGSVFLYGGVGGIHEIYNDHDEQASFAELGAGYGFQLFGQDVDARASIWQLISSDNVQNIFLVSMGVGF